MFTFFSSFDWVILGIISLVLIASDTKLGFLALWVFYFVLGMWMHSIPFSSIPATMYNHWFDIVMYIAAYLAIGTAWSILKWILFVREKANRDNLLLEKFKNGETSTKLWGDFSQYNSIGKPSVLDNKAKIVDWIIFWWFSIIKTFLGDWFYKLAVGLYNLFYKVYEAIGNKFYNVDVPDYLKNPEKYMGEISNKPDVMIQNGSNKKPYQQAKMIE